MKYLSIWRINILRFIHCADVHLDNSFSSISTERGVATQRKNDLREVFMSIMQLVKDKSANLWLISGDLVEMRHLMPSTIKFIADCFESVKPAKVVILFGNHDPYAYNSYHNSELFGDNVCFFNPHKKKLSFNDLNTDIYSYTPDELLHLQQNKKISDTFDPDRINILMLHGTVDINIGKNNYNQISSETLLNSNFDYIALGHFHKKYEGIGKSKKAYNPGSPEALGFDEEGVHGVFLVDLYKLGQNCEINSSFLKTGKRKYKSISINLKDISNEEELVKHILKTSSYEGLCDNDIIKIYLEKSKNCSFIPYVDRLIKILSSKFFHVEVVEDDIENYDFDKIIKLGGIRGTFVKNILRQISLESDEEKIKLMQKAIIYGLEALDHGKADINLC